MAAIYSKTDGPETIGWFSGNNFSDLVATSIQKNQWKCRNCAGFIFLTDRFACRYKVDKIHSFLIS